MLCRRRVGGTLESNQVSDVYQNGETIFRVWMSRCHSNKKKINLHWNLHIQYPLPVNSENAYFYIIVMKVRADFLQLLNVAGFSTFMS